MAKGMSSSMQSRVFYITWQFPRHGRIFIALCTEDLSVVIPNLNPVETEKVEREMRLVMATGSACDSASVHSNSSAVSI